MSRVKNYKDRISYLLTELTDKGYTLKEEKYRGVLNLLLNKTILSLFLILSVNENCLRQRALQ